MNYIIRKATLDDAEEILKHIAIVGGETDFLTFGAGGLKKTIEEEKQIILDHNNTDNQLFIVAEYEGKIIGVSNFMASQKPRLRHIGEFGISVVKTHWGKGVGTAMVKFIIDWARKGGIIRKINLIVQKDNLHAYRVYEKLGFEKEGDLRRALCIDGVFFDAFYMGMLI